VDSFVESQNVDVRSTGDGTSVVSIIIPRSLGAWGAEGKSGPETHTVILGGTDVAAIHTAVVVRVEHGEFDDVIASLKRVK
jgi:ethanolamine utilization microcompartment shell protein EutL